MLREIQQLSIFIILLLLGCAAQGPATGGLADKKGPKLITILPPKASLNVSQEQKITFTFDELLDPISVPASIKIESGLDYKLKIRGRKLIIYPKKVWPEDGIVRIDISRNIRDYQKNIMSEPIQLIFSTGSVIPNGTINGKIIDYDSNNLVELGLYEWPLSDSSNFINKVEADEMGNFQFGGIENGRYLIAALQGILWNMGKQLQNKNYAILTSNFILISPEEEEIMVKILLSNPVKRLKITSVEMMSQYSINLLMNDNSEEIFIIDTLLAPGDSIFINLEKSNRLETYQVPEYSFILPAITDTLAPKLSKSFIDKDKFTLVFSEPVLLNVNAIIIVRDSIDVPLPFEYENNYSIIIPTLADSISKIQLLGEYIHDKDGNEFADSVKTVSIRRSTSGKEEIIGGNIFGIVQYDGEESLNIQAHNIASDSYYWAEVENNKFQLLNLASGLYELFGFEVLNTLNPNIYFSGLWEPYHRAARFTMYPDTIDVRARWDVEGIIIDIE